MVTEEDNDLHIIVPDYIPIKIERILDSEGRGTGMNMLNHPTTTRTLLNLHINQSVSAYQEETRNVANTCFSLV